MKIAMSLFLVAAAAAAGLAVAQPKDRTGEEIVKARCAACHQAGVHGAPRIEDRAAWAPRMQKGLDATVRSAIKGHGSMPARGGLADLTDSEMRAAVIYLFNPAGIPTPPPPAPAPGPNQKVVGGTEVLLGVIPAGGGLFHVNITLRDPKTQAVIGDAQVEAKVTNPMMGSDQKKLNRIVVNNVVSYGNDFRLSGKEPHAIIVTIRRPPSSQVIEAKFDYRG